MFPLKHSSLFFKTHIFYKPWRNWSNISTLWTAPFCLQRKMGGLDKKKIFFILFILPTGQRSLAPKFWNSLDVRRGLEKISLLSSGWLGGWTEDKDGQSNRFVKGRSKEKATGTFNIFVQKRGPYQTSEAACWPGNLVGPPNLQLIETCCCWLTAGLYSKSFVGGWHNGRVSAWRSIDRTLQQEIDHPTTWFDFEVSSDFNHWNPCD